ncbi:MAG: 50S ribosomal protein L29 [Deltaproteobacteria bacterium]|nr:50S ribosomal protein L29 [Deltaproteobacteria bacterium]
MRAKELRERSDEELARLRNEMTEQLFKARLQNATHQLDNTSKIAKARREVARINTVLAERAGRPAAKAVGDEE